MAINYNSAMASSTDSTTYVFNAVRSVKSWLYTRIDEVKKYKPESKGEETESGENGEKKKITKQIDEAYVKGYKSALEDMVKVLKSQELA